VSRAQWVYAHKDARANWFAEHDSVPQANLAASNWAAQKATWQGQIWFVRAASNLDTADAISEGANRTALNRGHFIPSDISQTPPACSH
jgi:hypothetical protein